MINLDYWFIFPLALLGAIVANATGAGGGVVFVPAFHFLGIDHTSIIATSFAIQCFGMTAGMYSWRRYSKRQLQISTEDQKHWSMYSKLIWKLTPPSIIGLLIGQYFLKPTSAEQLVSTFKYFSIVFSIAIVIVSYVIQKNNRTTSAAKLNNTFSLIAISVSFIGGLITAWLSIGVGELIVVLLILIGFPVRLAIGVAVSVSAITVWFGVQNYLWFEPFINIDILAFAAPAAIVGGTAARYVTKLLSPTQLKLLIATWIFISAVAM